jgi:hypothetical protein
MVRRLQFNVVLVFVIGFVVSPNRAAAQADDDVPLGDFARTVRKAKDPAPDSVIDNDNLKKVLDDVQDKRLKGEPVFSIDESGKKFSMKSPDGTCSLSFDANAQALISNPFVPEQLPQSELLKLDGPATIDQNTLQLSVYNGTKWNVKEITVGLTIVRPQPESATYYGTGKLITAADENTTPAEKRSDLTVIYHLKGSAAPSETTVFHEDLGLQLDPGQEWHWSIIQAMGILPKPDEPAKPISTDGH